MINKMENKNLFGAGRFGKGGKAPVSKLTNQVVFENGENMHDEEVYVKNHLKYYDAIVKYKNKYYYVRTNVASGKKQKPINPNATPKDLLAPNKNGKFVVDFYPEMGNKAAVSETFDTLKQALQFANKQDSWNDDGYYFKVAIYGATKQIYPFALFEYSEVVDEDIRYQAYMDFAKDIKSKIKKIVVEIYVAAYRNKKIATHEFTTLQEANKFMYNVAESSFGLTAYINKLNFDFINEFYMIGY